MYCGLRARWSGIFSLRLWLDPPRYAVLQGVYPVSEQDSEIVNVPQRQYEEVVGTVGEEDRDEIDDAELDSLADEDDEQVEQEDEFEQEMDTGDLSERKQAKQSKAKPSGSKAEAGTASDEESAMEESDGGSGAEMQDEKEMELEREFVEAYDDDIMSDDDMEDGSFVLSVSLCMSCRCQLSPYCVLASCITLADPAVCMHVLCVCSRNWHER